MTAAALGFVGRFLGRYWPYLLIAIGIGIAVVKIDANGAARAHAQDEARRLERQADAQVIVDAIGRHVDQELAELARTTNRKIAQIDKEERTIVQPIIQSEIARDPSLLTRECLTPELLRAINASRGYPVGGVATVPDQRGSAPGVPGSAGSTKR